MRRPLIGAGSPSLNDNDGTKSKKKTLESILVIKQLGGDFEKKIPDGKAYEFAEEGQKILLSSESKDSLFQPGVYVFDCKKKELKKKMLLQMIRYFIVL